VGEVKGFLKYKRQDVGHRPVQQRIKDFEEMDLPLTPDQLRQQAARCMDCGIPFCHGVGCPLKNCVPDFNELVYKGRWQQACEMLHSTNNFPEITARVCPAPCEAACTLSISDEPVLIEGIEFQTGVEVGKDISARYLRKMFDCVCLTMGASQPRDLNIPGRGYENIVFAVEYLSLQNKLCTGEPARPTYSGQVDESNIVTAKNKVVVVIGGGDTGSDCVGTARRQGAKKIYQLEILPKPPDTRPPDTPWPMWPRIMRSSSSHEEGCERLWSVMTKKFSGVEIRVSQLECCRVEWVKQAGGWKIKELPGTDFILPADLVILALGFEHVVHDGLIKDLGLKLDGQGNVTVGLRPELRQGLFLDELASPRRVDNYQTSEPWVFAAGDAVNGASLVVTAINSGREAAAAIDQWLRGNG